MRLSKTELKNKAKVANKIRFYNDNCFVFNNKEIEEAKKSSISANNAEANGIFNLYISSNDKILKINKYNQDGEYLILGDGGDYASINYHNGKFSSTDHTWVIKYPNQNNKFMYFYWKKYIRNIDHCFQGTKLKNLKKPYFRKMNFIAPPLKDQNKIAKILSNKENHINNLKTLIEKLEKRNQYYANKLLTGELRVKEDANGNIEFYKNPDDNWKEEKVNGKIRKIPKDWDVEKNKNIFKEEKKSKIAVKDATNSGDYPFFNSSSELSMTHKTYNADGEYLILSTGGVASIQYYKGKFSYSSDTYLINSNNKNFNNKFLFYYWKNNTNHIERCFQGSGLKHLKKTLFKIEESVKPDVNEQINIAHTIDKVIFEKEKIKNLITKEQKQFEWLSEKLLSGEYVIEE